MPTLKATVHANRLTLNRQQAVNEFRDETSKEPEQDVPRSRPEPFSRQIARIFWLLLAGLVVGGGIFLATWDIPPPSGRVEQVLPDAQFPQ